MPTRVTGMFSGLDTESLISELVKAKKTKVTKYNKEKTKLEWKQEKWNDLNKKLKSLRSTITSMQFSTDYVKKKTNVSNPNAVSVITGKDAMNSVQSLKVKELAQSGYLTGDVLKTTDESKVTGETKLSDLGITAGASFSLKTGGKSTSIEVDSEMTVSQLVDKLKSAGVNANFDEKNARLFIGAKSSGTDADFVLTADNAAGLNAMNKLGINASIKDDKDATYAQYQSLANNLEALRNAGSGDAILNEGVDSKLYKLLKAEATDMEDPEAVESAYQKLLSKAEMASEVVNNGYGNLENSKAVRLYGTNAEIELNGASFTSSSNNIEVNGLTFTVMAKTAEDEVITVTTQDDTDGVYDLVKDFIKQYNDIVIELDKLYNAEVASKYEPLTDEEKEALSDSEVEKWENKIKDSILRRDESLGTLFNTLKDTMAAGIEIGGKKMYLSDFGINTLNYFEAPENEKAAYHIDGNPDDSETSGNGDKLKSMIATDSDTVVEFFTSLMTNLSTKMSKISASSNDQTYGSFYEDKKMKNELKDWDKKIEEAEKQLTEYEDKWYSKFSKMETALSKIDSKNSYLSGLFTK